MKIAVLEWLCSQRTTPKTAAVSGGQLPSLGDEGLAMLAVVVEGLCQAGHEVTTSVSAHLSAEVAARWQSTGINVVVHTSPSTSPSGREEEELKCVLDQWVSVAGSAECALLIAPEIDGVLETAIEIVGKQIRVINCMNPMLSVASDKWQTAIALSAARIAHPPTYLLSDYEVAGISGLRASGQLIAKCRDGAGCDATRVFKSAEALMAFKKRCDDPVQWIVQPFLDGESYSISCFAGPSGVAWMKPVRQNVIALEHASLADCSQDLGGGTRLEYSGAVVDIELPDFAAATRCAEDAIAAMGKGGMGWLGVDLLYEKNQRRWLAIEVNPRCTSSVLELSKAHHNRLGGNVCLLGQLWGYCILGQPLAPVGVIARTLSS